MNFSGNHMSSEKITQYTQLFVQYDYFSKGIIQMESLQKIIQSMHIRIHDRQFYSLLKQTGNNDENMITLTQFLAIISLITQDSEMDQQIEKTFEIFDLDKSGVIDSEDIKAGFQELDIDLTDADINEMFVANKKSYITYEAFHRNIMNK